VCPVCAGSGKAASGGACPNCRGTGIVTEGIGGG
jgi:DnaJ-class molecular chaperone